MNETLLASLRRRTDLAGWTLRRLVTRSTQLYSAAGRIEGERKVAEERHAISVVVATRGTDNSEACGTGSSTLLGDESPETAIERAVEAARLIHNPPHGLPGKSALPELSLVDKDLAERPAETLREAHATLEELAARNKKVRLTAAEWHATTRSTELVNSRGQEGEQQETALGVEWVIVTGEGEARAETFLERRLRRMADVEIQGEFELQAEMAVDRQRAGPAPDWEGPVVLRNTALATFLDAGPLQFLGSAGNLYAKVSSWEIGKTALRREGAGDPLTIYANRTLPFGVRASRFDDEGIPGQRLLIVGDNIVRGFSAAQRYAEYLDLPATGDFGDLELPAGRSPQADLRLDPHVEITNFSWFNPDVVTGDFATEIRFGYFVEGGRRTPFRGGLLIGNFLDALGDARWSRETAFTGNYQGPNTIRITGLKVAGRTAG
ncbi:MAG TPA: metallopeptidase TldD-related protein [Anaerolineales bacterium]|nr:metallopeptidase TldD-related protein [Anaerolineales bacterium]